MQLVFLAFQMIEETAHSQKSAFACNDHPLMFPIKFVPGHIQRDTGFASKALQVGKQRAIFGLGPRLDRALVKGQRLIRNHQVQIEIDRISESLAARTGAVRIVEREQSRFRFLVANIADLALETLGET